MNAYSVDDLRKLKRNVSEAMSILQTFLNQLYRQDVLKGCSDNENCLLSDLETSYTNSEEVVKSIDLLLDDRPPWEGEEEAQ